MEILTRADILAAKDVVIIEKKVPEWGGIVPLRTFSGATRAALFARIKKGDRMPDDFSERVLAASACDKDGNLIFTEADIKDLMKKNAVVVERLAAAAMDLNGLSEKSKDELQGE